MLVQMNYIEPHLGTSFTFILLLSTPIAIFGLMGVRDLRLILRLLVTKAFISNILWYFVRGNISWELT